MIVINSNENENDTFSSVSKPGGGYIVQKNMIEEVKSQIFQKDGKMLHENACDGYGSNVDQIDAGNDVNNLLHNGCGNQDVPNNKKTKATELSWLIWGKRWEEAETRCRQITSEVKTEVDIQVFRGGACRALPLHLACLLQPPLSMISSLLAVFPDAAKIAEPAWNQLPLHFACMGGASIEVMNELVKAFPLGIKMTESFAGYLPLHIACYKNASADVIDCLVREFPEGLSVEDYFGDIPMDIIRKGCNLNKEAILDASASAKLYAENKALKQTTEKLRSKCDDLEATLGEVQNRCDFLEEVAEKTQSKYSEVVFESGNRMELIENKRLENQALAFAVATKDRELSLLRKSRVEEELFDEEETKDVKTKYTLLDVSFQDLKSELEVERVIIANQKTIIEQLEFEDRDRAQSETNILEEQVTKLNKLAADLVHLKAQYDEKESNNALELISLKNECDLLRASAKEAELKLSEMSSLLKGQRVLSDNGCGEMERLTEKDREKESNIGTDDRGTCVRKPNDIVSNFVECCGIEAVFDCPMFSVSTKS